MERRFITSDNVELREDGNTISGLASVYYDGTERTQYKLWEGAVERISQGAFDRAIEDRQDVRALFNHNPDNLLGRTSAGTVQITSEERGLRYNITVDRNDPDHQRVLAKIKRNDLTGSSFAFQVKAERWTEEDGVEVRNIDDLDLVDVGPVTYPAYAGSTTGVRSDDSTDARASYEAYKETKRIQNRMQAINNT